MSLGFRLDETMTGFHEFDPGFGLQGRSYPSGKRFMEFVITWGPDDVVKWLNPFDPDFMTQPLKGHITIEGLCEKCPCEGTLTLAYHKGEICYDIRFEHDRMMYHYVGKKTNIRPWNLPISHTTCHGKTVLKTLFRDWDLSKSTVYFKFSTMWKFLTSFRFVNV